MSSRRASNQGVQRTGGQRRFAARRFSQGLVVLLPPPLTHSRWPERDPAVTRKLMGYDDFLPFGGGHVGARLSHSPSERGFRHGASCSTSDCRRRAD
jgi:hypothetical protein